jgi:LysR family transcriptional regulator, low CO2-responsive transcriptional regulator
MKRRYHEGDSFMRRLVDSRQLQAFVAVARRGSFTLAAEDLHLTQSAISHAIKVLEGDLGCSLMDRGGRRVHLTEAGERLLRHAENILREMDAVRTDLDAHSGLGRSHLRIGTSTTACQLILPQVIRQFRLSHPDCTIQLEPGDLGRQLELLRAGEADLAIGLEVPSPAGDGLAFVPLLDDELQFFVAPSHPWSKLGFIPREAIANQTLILYDRTSYTYRLMTEYFREEKVLLNKFIELSSMDAMMEVAKLGLGAAIMSPWIVRAEIKAGNLVALPLGRRKLRLRWAVAHWKGRRLAQVEETFIRICTTVAQSLN